MSIDIPLELGKYIIGIFQKFNKDNNISIKMETDINNLILKYINRPNYKFLEKIKERDILEKFISESIGSADLFCENAINNVIKKLRGARVDSVKVFLQELSVIIVNARAEFASEEGKNNYKIIQKYFNDYKLEVKAGFNNLYKVFKKESKVIKEKMTGSLKMEKRKPRPKKKKDISNEEFEKLSHDEAAAYIKSQIDYDPQGAFLDMALSAFGEGNEEDFDFLAGMAVQYSDFSILTEITMTVVKTMLIMKIKDPECVDLRKNNSNDYDILNLVKNNCYARLYFLADLLIELIEQERKGKIMINNRVKISSRNILFDLIDIAVKNKEELY